MLPALDVATMLLMTAVASFAMAGALAAVRPEQREGIGLWALALVLHGTCYVLYALRGQVPAWASVVLANALLSGSFALILGAIEQFHGRPAPWWRMVLPVAVLTLLFALYIDRFTTRVGMLGVVLSLQLLLMLWALWRPAPPAQVRGAWLLTAGLGLQVLLLTSRGWLVATGRAGVEQLMQASALQAVSFVAAFVVVILASLGFILMAKDRSDAAHRHLAAHDALTGLANRRALMQMLERGVAHATRTQQECALLLLDIDHFKAINDTHGHLGGDQVLRHVAEVLRTRVRAQDFVGRYGGEEFMVLLPGTGREGALQLAETLRQAVADSACPLPGGAIATTISIGVCAGAAGLRGSAPALVQCADQALYAAKAAGRNRVEYRQG